MLVPNQRAKNKVRLGGFVERQLYRAIVAQAKHAGMAHNKFGFVQRVISEALTSKSGPRRRTTTQSRNRQRLSSG